MVETDNGLFPVAQGLDKNVGYLLYQYSGQVRERYDAFHFRYTVKSRKLQIKAGEMCIASVPI